ncbi:MAG: M24 family metallopeptidase [Candidatus Magnetoovum sp. WYHC-5]|nr:M24 family metallopeptidase [Candidatus Magnetoovum sp. WYHC-5]
MAGRKAIIIKSKEEIDRIRVASKIVGYILKLLDDVIQPGITTKDIEGVAEDVIKKEGATSAFKNYKGYPAILCASINTMQSLPTGITSRCRDRDWSIF